MHSIILNVLHKNTKFFTNYEQGEIKGNVTSHEEIRNECKYST